MKQTWHAVWFPLWQAKPYVTTSLLWRLGRCHLTRAATLFPQLPPVKAAADQSCKAPGQHLRLASYLTSVARKLLESWSPGGTCLGVGAVTCSCLGNVGLLSCPEKEVASGSMGR